MMVYGSYMPYIQIPNLGATLVTLFGSNCYDGMSAGIGVIHTGPKSGGKKVTLFGSNCYDGVSAGVGVIRTGPLMIA